MIVNVCPAATTNATPDRVWSVLMATDRYGEWTDARFVRAVPPGPATRGQVVVFAAPVLGRALRFTITIEDLDPKQRWIDMLVRLPFGIDNHEHLTLTDTKEGGTLIRFN